MVATPSKTYKELEEPGVKEWDARIVKVDSLQKLLCFMHHPRVKFNGKYYWAWEEEIKIFSYSGYSKNPFPLSTLIHKCSKINHLTGKKKKALELRLDDFKKIKEFWIKKHANENLYKKIKNILKLSEKDSYLHDQFYRLIHQDVICFTIKIREVQENYLTFWLNFIFKTTEKSKLNPIERPELKDEKKWRKIRNWLIHNKLNPKDLGVGNQNNNSSLWLYKFSNSPDNFTLTFKTPEDPAKLRTETYKWQEFDKFRNNFLCLIENKLKSK